MENQQQLSYLKKTTNWGYSPNYDHPKFIRKNPCHENFMDCEGDCKECPNKTFFENFEKEHYELIGLV